MHCPFLPYPNLLIPHDLPYLPYHTLLATNALTYHTLNYPTVPYPPTIPYHDLPFPSTPLPQRYKRGLLESFGYLSDMLLLCGLISPTSLTEKVSIFEDFPPPQHQKKEAPGRVAYLLSQGDMFVSCQPKRH